jgi:hypothetical protein
MMRFRSLLARNLRVVAVAFLALGLGSVRAQTGPTAQTRVLLPQDLTRTMPDMVFFRGQSASVQLRNTYGLRFPGGALMMAALVDSSGYSSGIRQKYQGYLLSEVKLSIGGKMLLPGAYGFGMLADGNFVVMDLGAKDILQTMSHTDAAMTRPRPIQIQAGQHAGSYRLYEGRKFISIRPM